MQYAYEKYQRLLSDWGALFHESQGDCWDNAVVESFFPTLKKELISRTRFKTRNEARAAIFGFIEVFYNRIWIHSTLEDTSPAEYEAQKAA